MERENFNILDLADFTKAIADYQIMGSQFPQYGHLNKDNLNTFLEKHKSKERYWDSPVLNTWHRISVHVTYQTWGSTSCGWGGIGGSAMTTSMNVVIENMYTGLTFVYWGGRLAYATNKDNIPDFYNVPSLSEAKGCVYKHSIR